MKLTIKNNSSTTEIIIEKNIKSLSDNDEIKIAIEDVWSMNDEKPIEIHIKDSFIITSSVIGFLIKFIKKDKIPITLYITNSELYEMLDDMNLVSVLNIKKAIY
jgi:hypothetical protein